MEDYMYEWCRFEYTQMAKYISPSPSLYLILTNTECMSTATEDENTTNLADFHSAVSELKMTSRVILLPKSVKQLLSQGTESEKFFEFNHELIDNNTPVKIPLKKICMLDMRANSTLSHSDNIVFDAYLFGGILGDHPPKDRAKVLRDDGYTIRQLGT